MAGHRDDGTFAEDKAHHPNRKIQRPETSYWSLPRLSKAFEMQAKTMGSREKYDAGTMEYAMDTALRLATEPKEPIEKQYGYIVSNNKDFIGEHSNENDETLDPWDQEDINEQQRFKDEANKRGHL